MPEVTSHDDALLARLNALKKSSVSFSTSLSSSMTPSFVNQHKSTSAQTDLAARFARLGSASPSSSPKPSRTTSTDDTQREGPPLVAPGAPSYLEGIAEGVGGSDAEANAEDERSLEELLGELGPREEWDLSGGEQRGVRSLLKEIRTILPEVKRGREEGQGRQKGEALTDWENVEVDIGRGGVKVGREEDGGNEDEEDGDEVEEHEGGQKKTEDEEADDVIARIMAELEISKKYDPPPPPPEDDKASNPEEEPLTPTKPSPSQDLSEATNDLALPSAPTSLPSPSPTTTQSTTIEDALSARLSALSRPNPETDALGLPSAPSFAPARKPPTVTSSFAKEPDDEVDSWCVICTDDATLRCTGCDDDLYCQNCWMEGHRGEAAGWEEKRHKAVLYSKNKKRRKEAAA